MTRIYLSPPHLSGDELALVADAIASNWIAPLGPHVDAFEAELSARLGELPAVALASGTAALHLALLVAGVQPGDHVLCSTLTFVATANAIRYAGAIPVFVDSDPDTWTIDPALVADELARRARAGAPARAVVTVDVYGQPCDYAPLRAACEAHGAVLIQDAAEALGATYRGEPVGVQGDLAAFSFNGNKIITTSGGGLLVAREPAWIAHARKLATQAREPVAHYEHEEVGFNYRLSNLLAAVGRAQLARLDERVARRRAIHARYRAALGDLPGVALLRSPPYGDSSHWLTCATIDAAALGASREDLRRALDEADIEARPVWKPMHLQPVYRDAPRVGGDVAADRFERGLCLPSGSSLSDADVDRVVAVLRRRAGHG